MGVTHQRVSAETDDNTADFPARFAARIIAAVFCILMGMGTLAYLGIELFGFLKKAAGYG